MKREWLKRMVEEHKLVRRLALLWGFVIVTWCLMGFWDRLAEINSAHATVLVAVIGLVSVVTGFYITGRDK